MLLMLRRNGAGRDLDEGAGLFEDDAGYHAVRT
jgi:hypothetical protein